jgi:PadR family transcriptional regulator, regulatory protein AphA
MVRRSLTIEHALLGFLQAGPLHGYQIHQQVSDPLGLKRVWYLKQAQLYALLDKLEEAGFVASTIQLQETRPARRVFHMTDAGQQAFQDWLFSPVQRPREMRQEFQAKLYFARRQDHAAYERLIAAQRQVCQQWLAEQESLSRSDNPSEAYLWLIDQYRAGQIRATLDWLDTCQLQLDGRTPALT